MTMEGSEFDRMDIVRNIAAGTEVEGGGQLSQDLILEVLKSEHSTIADALCVFDGRVEIKDFGTFTIELRPPDSGIDPNGNPWETPERYKVKFKAAPAFAQIIEERTGISAY